ncbi:MAG: hypothetical protein ACLVIY_00695 [Anaerobutyricum soehngenii]
MELLIKDGETKPVILPEINIIESVSKGSSLLSRCIPDKTGTVPQYYIKKWQGFVHRRTGVQMNRLT